MAEQDLNTQAELAADYIEEFLDIADIDGDIEIGVKNDRPFVSIVSENSEDTEKLIGKDGEALLALQELTRLAVGEESNERTGLLVDVNGWRGKRIEQIKATVDEKFAQLEKDGVDAIHLDASLNSFERKTVHDYVSEKGLFSHSEGFAKERHIVLTKEDVEEDKVVEEPTQDSE